MQVPIGSEDDFVGVVDLITGKGITWNDEDMGMTFEEMEIPEDLKETVQEYRDLLIEAIAESDDALMEKFFEDPESITVDEMMAAIRVATINMSIQPVMCGSAFKNKGVQTMLDAVMAFMPSPLDIEGIEGINPDTDEPAVRKPSTDEPMASLAFKIATDPFVGRLCFVRCYSGQIPAGSYVFNTRSGKKERISRLFQMHSNKQNSIEALEAGDIGAAVGFKDIRTGDTLCDEKNKIVLESMDFPDPVIGIAIEPKTQADMDKLGVGLNKLSEEDPTFQVKTDEDSGQTIISGMGELHLEILVERLKREFKVEVNEGQPHPDPVIGIAIEPKTQADMDKLGVGLNKLSEEDPTFQVKTDEDSGQTIISGMGELHLEILVERLKREFKVEVNEGQPQVSYKENITKVVDHREVYKKQSGGRGKFADIVVRISPQEDPEKTGLEFVNAIKGGNVPREFIPSVEKGFKMSMKNGVMAGFPLDSMKVELLDGSFHAVDSDALSFEVCAKMAFRNALKQAGPKLLEPIMALEVVTPEENMGDVVADLNRRRGMMKGMDDRNGAKVVKADVPLSEMFGYVTQLRTITSGRASSTMEFALYAEAPKNIAEAVVAKVKGVTA